MSNKQEYFKNVSPEVLLLNGSKSPLFLKNSTDALNKVLPHATHKELSGLDLIQHKTTVTRNYSTRNKTFS